MSSSNEKTPHQAIREWIQYILDIKGWNPTRLAKEAGVSPSTISRALNDDRFVLTTRTINKIRKITGNISDERTRSKIKSAIDIEFLDEPEIVKTDQFQTGGVGLNFPDERDISYYLCRSTCLELLGIVPGDFILVDQSDGGSTCKAGDIALAKIKSSIEERMVLRFYDPPYLLTKSFSPHAEGKPLLVDGASVAIVGRTVALIRLMISASF